MTDTQQVETKSRSNTLTDDNVGQTSTVTSSDGPQPSSTPNCLLFKLFLENLKATHDREVDLQDAECEQLISLIRQRERDTDKHPLPFMFAHIQPKTHLRVQLPSDGLKSVGSNISLANSLLSVGSGITGQSQGRTESVMSSRTSQSQVGIPPASQLQTSSLSHTQKPTVIVGNQHPHMDSPFSGSKPKERTTDQNQANASDLKAKSREHRSDTDGHLKNSPRWRCFVKAVTGTHILLCFVPASYSDLKLLTTESDPETPESAPVQDVSGSGSRHPTGELSGESRVVHFSDRSRHSTGESGCRHRQPSGDSSKSAPGDGLLTHGCQKEPPLSTADSEWLLGQCASTEDSAIPSDFLPANNYFRDCSHIPKDSKSLKLPVYIYNCPLRVLTEQLVNKWTFVRPPDVFEDLVFAVDDTSFRQSAGLDTSEGCDINEKNHRRHRPSECEKWKQARDEDPAIYENDEDLRGYCDQVSDIFSRSFVSGICMDHEPEL